MVTTVSGTGNLFVNELPVYKSAAHNSIEKKFSALDNMCKIEKKFDEKVNSNK